MAGGQRGARRGIQDKGGVRSREGGQAAREEGGGEGDWRGEGTGGDRRGQGDWRGRGTGGAGGLARQGEQGTPGDQWRQWALQAPKLGEGMLLRAGSLAG